MKKVRLSGKELRRLGFPSEVSISLAKTAIAKYYKRSTKREILELLSASKNARAFDIYPGFISLFSNPIIDSSDVLN